MMTIQQLIEKLQRVGQDCGMDTEVRIAQPTHNHWQQVIAAEIRKVEDADARYSEYNQNLLLVEETDRRETDAEIDANQPIVILR